MSYNIDKLLRDIQGASQHQHRSQELHAVSSASNPTNTSFSNGYSLPHMGRSRHPINVQDQYPSRGRGADVEYYGSPLDAFGKHLISSTQSQLLIVLADHALLAEPTEATHRFDGMNQSEQIQQHQRGSHTSNKRRDKSQSSRPDAGEDGTALF